MTKARKYYDKISSNIESSTNELHIRTCSTMIGMFSMRFIDDEDINHIQNFETMLKDELDIKANKLGLITI
jgi:hypothetical protein